MFMKRVCYLLIGSVLISGVAVGVRAQAPPAAPSPSGASDAAAAPTYDQVVEQNLQLKQALNEKDAQIGQLLVVTANCRGELLKQERAAHQAKITAAGKPEPKPEVKPKP